MRPAQLFLSEVVAGHLVEKIRPLALLCSRVLKKSNGNAPRVAAEPSRCRATDITNQAKRRGALAERRAPKFHGRNLSKTLHPRAAVAMLEYDLASHLNIHHLKAITLILSYADAAGVACAARQQFRLRANAVNVATGHT